jgi:hypothetical protein
MTRPGLHRTSAFSRLALFEIEAEAAKLNAETTLVYLEDRDDVIELCGLDKWGEILTRRIENACFVLDAQDRLKKRRRA